MLLKELFEETIPTLDPTKMYAGIFKKYEGYPTGSLSPREIISTQIYDNITLERAKEICDELNATITASIFTFHEKLSKKKK